MNYLRLLLLFSLCGNMVILRAQEKKGVQGDPYKEIYDLKKELEKKESRIGELELELANMTAKKKKVDSLLNAEKTIGKSKEIKSQLQALEKENKALKAELEACSGKVEEAINKQVKNSQNVIAQFQQQHAKDSAEIETLKRNLADLSGFRKMWIAQLAESVNEKWLEKPYSKINITELEAAFKQYEEFASSDKKISDARDKLRNLLQDCRIYGMAVKAVHSQYNKTSINAVALSVKNLRDKTTDINKKEELSLLYWQLDNYGVTVEIFQDVIKAVDEQIAGMPNHNSAWRLAKAVLEKQEKDDEYITAINKIPWLSQQYKMYSEALERNCIAPNKVRNIIMNLQP